MQTTVIVFFSGHCLAALKLASWAFLSHPLELVYMFIQCIAKCTLTFFTGKSLSLICGALTWFLASEKRRKEQLENQVKDKVEDEDEVCVNTDLSNIASIT